MKSTSSIRFLLLPAALIAGGIPTGHAQLYYKSTTAANAWTGSFWGTSAAGPFTGAWTPDSAVVFVDNGGTALALTGATTNFSSITANENVNVTASGTIGTSGTVASITVAAGKNLNFGTQAFSTAAGTGITKNGDGILTLAGAAYTGGFTINAGTVAVAGVNAMGAGGALTINGGTIRSSAATARDLTGKYAGGITIGGNFTLGDAINNGLLTFTNAMALGAANRIITVNSTATFGGAISGSAGVGLTKTGPGQLTLSVANDYTGTTTISDGTLTLSGSLTGGGAVSTSGTGLLNQTTAGLISGASTVTLNNATGQNVLVGANTYTGGFTLGNGALVVVGTSSTGTVGSPTTSAFGAGATAAVLGTGSIRSTNSADTTISNTLTLAGNLTAITVASEKSLTFSGPATLTGTRTFDVSIGNTVAGKSLTFSGNIGQSGGSYGINKTGTGLMVLSGTNDYSGATTISAGTLGLTGSLTGGGAISTSGTGVGAGILTQGAGGVISGASSFTQGSSGISTLAGNNSYTGLTTISAGDVNITHANALGGTDNGTTVASTATLVVLNGITTNSGESITIAGSGRIFFGALRAGAGGGTWAGPVNLDAAPRIGASAGNTLTVTGSIVDGTGNTFAVSGEAGTGVVVLNPTTSNTYSGKTDIIRGILRLGKTDALPTGTTLDVDSFTGLADAATFDMAGFDQTVAALQDTATTSINGKITNIGGTGASTSTLTVNQVVDTDFAGVIENGAVDKLVALTKSGSGVLTLSGANTHTGDTLVSGGTLAVNGSLANTTTTVASARLQGSGLIVGPVTIGNNGTLAAGNSIEALGVGALTFDANSTFDFEFQTNLFAGTPNASADLTYSSSTLAITSGAILTLTDLGASTALTLGSKLTLVSYSGATPAGVFTHLGSPLADGDIKTIGANQWQFNYADTTGGSNFTLDQTGATKFFTMAVVPEAGTAGLLALGLLLLRRLRRR